jgi:undecaprenyl-diphosphatase
MWHALSAGLLLRSGPTRRIGVAGTAGWAAASTVDWAIKLAVQRRRPRARFSRSSTRSSSMPSSHAASAAAYAAAATTQHPAAAVLAAPAATVAWSRLGTRQHFPTDVVAGLLLGVAVGVGTGLIIRRVRPAERPGEVTALPLVAVGHQRDGEPALA